MSGRALSAAPTDVQQTLSYGRGKLSLKYIAITAPFAALGLFVLAIPYLDDKFHAAGGWRIVASGWGLAAFGILVFARELYEFGHPGAPLLVLAPKGLALNIDGLDFCRIPWSEVRDVTAIDLTTRATVYVPPSERRWGGSEEIVGVYKGVTAVVISRDFYDRAILPLRAAAERSRGLATILKLRNGMIDHIRARRGLGRGWSSIFIRQGSDVCVALHHSILPVSRVALHAAVEARWHAFGHPPSPA